ncbi:hypothetical protein [Aliagarivorans taiwanensis]|uniref:hypothetical protein n=1 Tax=Aliagarivorans taiwanensis TaxID=561966 RepID=UPI000408CE46|nr:hypothetical protein [Aliagarivorans taiwanensis]
MVKTTPDKLLSKHAKLCHSDNLKVVSHQQRQQGEWIRHSLMIEGVDVPFVFKRRDAYRNLTGQRVNLSYYPSEEQVGGLGFEIMKVVRIKRS